MVICLQNACLLTPFMPVTQSSSHAPEYIYALMQPRLRTPPRVSLEPNTGLDITRTIWLNMQHSMEYPSIDGFWYLAHAALCWKITNGSR